MVGDQFVLKLRRRLAFTMVAFTMVELVVVLLVVIAIAGTLVPLFGRTVNDAQDDATVVSLSRLRVVIMGQIERPGYFTQVRALPDRMADLFAQPGSVADYNPLTQTGWNGPYLLNSVGIVDNTLITTLTNNNFFNGDSSSVYLQNGDSYIVDAYTNPVVLQRPNTGGDDESWVRLISAGPNGVIVTPRSVLMPSSAQRDDDIVLFLTQPDPG